MGFPALLRMKTCRRCRCQDFWLTGFLGEPAEHGVHLRDMRDALRNSDLSQQDFKNTTSLVMLQGRVRWVQSHQVQFL